MIWYLIVVFDSEVSSEEEGPVGRQHKGHIFLMCGRGFPTPLRLPATTAELVFGRTSEQLQQRCSSNCVCGHTRAHTCVDGTLIKVMGPHTHASLTLVYTLSLLIRSNMCLSHITVNHSCAHCACAHLAVSCGQHFHCHTYTNRPDRITLAYTRATVAAVNANAVAFIHFRSSSNTARKSVEHAKDRCVRAGCCFFFNYDYNPTVAVVRSVSTARPLDLKNIK